MLEEVKRAVAIAKSIWKLLWSLLVLSRPFKTEINDKTNAKLLQTGTVRAKPSAVTHSQQSGDCLCSRICRLRMPVETPFSAVATAGESE